MTRGRDTSSLCVGDVHTKSFDVLVIGAGLAGISAAIEASRSGASVALVSDGLICSGSSFSKLTWGLGMIAPREASGKRGPESLSKALSDVGMSIESKALRDALARDSLEVPGFLESLGVSLKVPEHPDEPQYIPCFDQELRSWRGFEGLRHRDALVAALESHGVSLFENTAPLSLIMDGSSLRGAFTLHKMIIPTILEADATIIATGGFASLWEHALSHPSCTGMGHLMALDAGASLTNIEFVQLMTGFYSPTGLIIHNEKLYATTVFDFSGQPHPAGIDDAFWSEALRIHAGHGPYTSRLDSRVVEESVAAAARSGTACKARYALDETKGDIPEFVATYLRFLSQRGLDGTAWFEPVVCAHSCNGGIRIDEHASTGISGLYACGEAAGGVHGADRLGGMASVAAVCFGRIAARSAASEASSARGSGRRDYRLATPLACLDLGESRSICADVARALQAELTVPRTHDGLADARAVMERALLRTCQAPSLDPSSLATPGAREAALGFLAARRASLLGTALANVADARTESRGSHARADYPACDDTQAFPSCVRLGDDGIPHLVEQNQGQELLD